MTTTFTTKLGTTRAGPRTRIWIEGQRLLDAGFVPGMCFTKTWNDVTGKLTLACITAAYAAQLPRAVVGRVSSKGTKPIIDITGAKVAEFFGQGETVNVLYRPNTIIIGG